MLHNLVPAQAGPEEDSWAEYDSPETIAAIQAALTAPGVEVVPVGADRTLAAALAGGRYDLAFNIAEGVRGRCREAIAAAVCESLEVPYTGSDPLTLALTLDKWMARRVVSAEVPVARGLLWMDGQFDRLRYPVMVKPNNEGSSKGIRRNSVARDAGEMRDLCAWLFETYGCPVLIEEYVQGAEVTVGIQGNGAGARVIGMMEIAPRGDPEHFVYSFEVKKNWREEVRYFDPPRLAGSTLTQIEELALRAYALLGCRDIARIDFRLDREGTPHFIECNPLPGLNPDDGDLVLMTRERIAYRDLVRGILLAAAERLGVRVE